MYNFSKANSMLKRNGGRGFDRKIKINLKKGESIPSLGLSHALGRGSDKK